MHAFEDIAGLYREELRSLREDAVRFAVRNPGMARQLGLASDTQPDPLVNLLLESFAWLAARVRADAEKGKANQALEKLIADWLGVSPSQVSVVGGATSRLKTVSVAGDPRQLAEHTEAKLAAL